MRKGLMGSARAQLLGGKRTGRFWLRDGDWTQGPARLWLDI